MQAGGRFEKYLVVLCHVGTFVALCWLAYVSSRSGMNRYDALDAKIASLENTLDRLERVLDTNNRIDQMDATLKALISVTTQQSSELKELKGDKQ